MNDDIREKLSAYLDGALPDLERKTLEGELSRSEELRLELEALRAVSSAVKSLPKEPLPAGFAARLEARRAREGAPEREYFILPPAYRPLAFALSTAVVALVVWDRTLTKPDVLEPRAGWDSEVVSVKSAADAPPSIDVSGALSAMNASGDAAEPRELAAKKEDAADDQLAAPATLGKNLSAPGKPLEIDEAEAPAAGEGGGAMLARSEEERSAINERLYTGFEEEKKRMGIAKIMDRDEEPYKLSSGGREFMALQASPEAARVEGRRASVASVRGAARSKAGAPA
ncbi:MAG: zf-HC2 domain-containing protein, partial [Elusimicrobia bacterium]|nr:zf-HC2 domain-containing protein [Elusimicrobiota bacterium]